MLAPWMSFCRIDDTCVFLDVRRNRYTALPWVTAKSIIHGDQCAMPPQVKRQVQALGWLDVDASAPDRPTAERLALEELDPRFRAYAPSPRLIVEAFWLLGGMRLRLAAFSFERVLSQVTARNLAASRDNELDPAIVAPLLAAFMGAERFALTSNTCLLRSLALHAALARRGIATNLVFGVKLHPFEAHCWLQQGTTLLNDTIERTGLFAPIRVVS